ncbi:MAG: tRNA (adenosine(37)-N6)-dimethylallyltransferase MiaA [Actinomycetota bacterium]|nr:tRNA (adenosine(37)-N6)-dimethylallyltransferase MiaA [Actinomycetota bacterium]
MSASLVVLGATASGKSDVAMAYAQRHAGVEIVAVDALQVYRRMNIGTAKPTACDQAAVPHHGLDLAEPTDEFAVSDYVRSVGGAMVEMEARGVRALLVGGTGLYLRALTDPMELPGRWPLVRAQLEARVQVEGSAVLHGELAALDAVAAARMEPTNARRVVRALEVVLGSGRPFSSFGPGLDQYPPINSLQVGIRWPRDVLSMRIAERVHRMVELGLVAEVEGLLAEPGGLSRTARQGLGYKEIIDHVEGRCTLAEAVDTVILRTRQFAVRQERWFRRDPRIRWVDVRHDPVAEVLPVIEAL